ncbi:hypothetical protein Tco_0939022 [Tanacetum coccineum]|uniref:Uncharacterized protein n=1 Tax=Tanacetum coccineum TaxID=301880 RepID=A0ABQ5DJQ4_9ASTR
MAERNVPTQPPTNIQMRRLVLALEWLNNRKSQPTFNAQKRFQKNPIFQISVDILSNTNFFQAFTASANVPAIYLQTFWNTMKYNRKTGVYIVAIDEQFNHEGNSIPWESTSGLTEERTSGSTIPDIPVSAKALRKLKGTHFQLVDEDDEAQHESNPQRRRVRDHTPPIRSTWTLFSTDDEQHQKKASAALDGPTLEPMKEDQTDPTLEHYHVSLAGSKSLTHGINDLGKYNATAYKVPEENKLQRKTYDIEFMSSKGEWFLPTTGKRRSFCKADLEGPASTLFRSLSYELSFFNIRW